MFQSDTLVSETDVQDHESKQDNHMDGCVSTGTHLWHERCEEQQAVSPEGRGVWTQIKALTTVNDEQHHQVCPVKQLNDCDSIGTHLSHGAVPPEGGGVWTQMKTPTSVSDEQHHHICPDKQINDCDTTVTSLPDEHYKEREGVPPEDGGWWTKVAEAGTSASNEQHHHLCPDERMHDCDTTKTSLHHKQCERELEVPAKDTEICAKVTESLAMAKASAELMAKSARLLQEAIQHAPALSFLGRLLHGQGCPCFLRNQSNPCDMFGNVKLSDLSPSPLRLSKNVFGCAICDKRFGSWSGADSHIRQMHTHCFYGPCKCGFSSPNKDVFRRHSGVCQSDTGQKKDLKSPEAKPENSEPQAQGILII